jgi:quercetin dioxygenase-like cupin family protein
MVALHPLPPEDQAVTVDWVTVDGVFIKQILIPKAYSAVPQHAHVWDHTTMLARGAVLLRRGNGPWERYVAPKPIFIEKGVKHAFVTLVDATLLFCIHALHNSNTVEILKEHEISEDDIAGLAEFFGRSNSAR